MEKEGNLPVTDRLRIEIQGAVQGVGFRPFTYRLAEELGLSGSVLNDPRGVLIEVEGPRARLERFLTRLHEDKPPLALIQSLATSWHPPQGSRGFEIRSSLAEGAPTAPVLPDLATCPECLMEILDPHNRRYRYPFTNCTNCGPRFSIIKSLPYDRHNTTMERFILCPLCGAEYTEPKDRRFHAQPDACAGCGPRISLLSREGRILAQEDEALAGAARALADGRIVAVKGLGGFHLMVDARNREAVTHLRESKPRRDKPLAVMASDLEQAQSLCEISPTAEAALVSSEAPILLLPRRKNANVADNVAPSNPCLGVMLPYTPLHHLLMRETGFPVVATSGNLSDEPICIDEVEAFERLGPIAGLFLIHDRPIARHVDDSVAWILDGETRLLRRARGYAPLPILLRKPVPTILAVGGHLKNTVALSVDHRVFLSQHIGDLDTPESLRAFERVIRDFLRLYESVPVAVAHDLHPDYLSTQWAVEAVTVAPGTERRDAETVLRTLAGLPRIPVQHHHAHLAACLAENGIEGQALGVTWDGTGYGTDGTVWGGEFLMGSAADFRRVGHLLPFRLPGGDAAIREPRRSALGVLWEVQGEKSLEREELAPVRTFSESERRLLAQMLRSGTHAPLTTSAGRLFDAVSSLLDLKQKSSYEGQAAMALEFAAHRDVREAYPLPLTARETIILDWRLMIENILSDLLQGQDRAVIAAKFHNTLIKAIREVATTLGASRVALAGGCFQNRRLTEGTAEQLEEAGLEVLLHRQVSPNDGSISLGQVAVAAASMESGRSR